MESTAGNQITSKPLFQFWISLIQFRISLKLHYYSKFHIMNCVGFFISIFLAEYKNVNFTTNTRNPSIGVKIHVIITSTMLNKSSWILKYFHSLLAHLGQVSYCHHLASVVVVRRPSYVVNFFKNLLWKYQTNGNHTWSESSLGCLVSKLCPVLPCTNQHGRCY